MFCFSHYRNLLCYTVGAGALNCLLRSVGVVKWPAITNVAAFYIVGIPLGAWLTFGDPHWGIFGLWTGLAAGMFLMVLALGVSVRYLYLLKALNDSMLRGELMRILCPR
jgi:MATE family multidrug resistance protein